MSVVPFRPITKEQAAEILGASVRTIENYVSDNLMPAPVAIGRRVYWHPDIFYSWLDGHLRGATSTQNEVKNATDVGIQTSPRSDAPISSTKRKSVTQVPGTVGTKALSRAAAKSKALIEQLCND